MKTNSHIPSPDALLAFDALARLGSFTAAAEAIGCAKSRISQLVKDLERELGTVLVLRNTRRVALTEAGRRLACHAAQLRSMLDKVRPDIEEAQGALGGPLRVSSTASFAQYLLGPLLGELAARHPALEVELVADNRLQDPVEAGLDFCLRTRNVHDERLVAKSIGFVWEELFAAPAYLEQAGIPQTPEELLKHRLLHNSYSESGLDWRLEKEGQFVSVTIRPTLLCDQYAVIANAACAGQGIGLLPQYVVRQHLARGELSPVLPGWRSSSWPVFLVYPYRQPMPKKYEAFLQFVIPRLRGVLGHG
ncbi:MAG: LysR family transcriptional regulator [Pseudogulbenkiania sp.]|nr:LysR family transcriptional regulator [Pseudogulbenkiania sp.]